MDDIHARPDSGGLFAVASEQAGYFTAAQAHTCGYDLQLLSYHASSGRFIRLRRGLYRLRDYPTSPHEEVTAAWLAAGRESAVVSHESALELLGLSDVIPNAVHLLIPRSRRGLPRTPGVALHTTAHALTPEDITVREGIRLTAPLRTILDVAEAGTATEQVIMAAAQAQRWGWLTPDALRARAGGRRRRAIRLIEQGLSAA